MGTNPSADGKRRSQNQRSVIADPSRGMLVDHRPGQSPGTNLTGIKHRKRKLDSFRFRQPIYANRHGKGRGLGITDRSVRQTVGEVADLRGIKEGSFPYLGKNSGDASCLANVRRKRNRGAIALGSVFPVHPPHRQVRPGFPGKRTRRVSPAASAGSHRLRGIRNHPDFIDPGFSGRHHRGDRSGSAQVP